MRLTNNHITKTMRSHGLVAFVVIVLVLFGIYSLPQMNKDEFPQFTIRQGVVVAIYPGATAQEIEDQVTKPLEQYLFTFSEIDKEQTYSVTENGAVYIYAMLRNEVPDKDVAWSKIRHGLDLFKMQSLPVGVVAVAVIDDFGNTSSMLLAVQSEQRTPRELEFYAEEMAKQLRNIPAMGNIKIIGKQHEEIAVYIDAEKLSHYAIDQKTLLVELATQGFRATTGTISNSVGEALVHTQVPYQSEYQLAEQIVYIDPLGNSVKLRDIAQIKRQYAEPTEYVEFYSHDQIEQQPSACVIISIEMFPGNNIVKFGKKVDEVINKTKASLPPDVRFTRITDQPKVVNSSVMSFLRDLLLSMLVVIMVMLLLFPLRTALVACTGVPVCTAVAIGLMYLTGIELNTVTLAALIVVLGMIVDDSVIVIDGYTERLDNNHSRWYSAVTSTSELFIPMTLATCAISGMFFPMTKIITGPLGEFVQLFPWAVLFALTASILYAAWVIPSLSTRFIRVRSTENLTKFEQYQTRFFDFLQRTYDRMLGRCFRHPIYTLLTGLSLIVLGGFLFTRLNIQMMPKAERENFAVEIHLAEGSTLKQTALVADSMARILQKDDRVLSVTSFVGCSSPRFNACYAPQMPHKNYAQFIVATKNQDATAAVLKDYSLKYANLFPNAYIRFKQMDYQAVNNPIELHIKGNDLIEMERVADSLKLFMQTMPQLTWIHSNYDETRQDISVRIKPDEAMQFGVTQSMISLYLSNALSGQALTSLWENDYRIPVMLRTDHTDDISYQELEDMLIPTSIPGVWVPLRQIATIEPLWHHAQIGHRNGIRTITVGADLKGKAPQPKAMKQIKQYASTLTLPEGITVEDGGLSSINTKVIPELAMSVFAAIFVMFVLLLFYFAKLPVALLTLASSLLTIFGAVLGLTIFRLDFSITALLGLVSLIGIIVRNAIIMYEYAEQLRKQGHTAKQAAFLAGERRMRPIFLTSATTALGVIPMIIAHTSLWMPMGVVICFGTLFTLPLVVTILPVAYWKTFNNAKV
ncbi:MAG: efflux RND transporter permease subunit [Paludibacteraceae bacterium]|nr:efflux RND transporter permease subunit [Paludibacteraceae bacterium]